MNRFASTVAAATVSLALIFGATVPAQAATSSSTSGSASLSASDPTLYLLYANGHSPWNLDIYATVIANSNAPYAISMYNSSGQLLWSAGNQTRRTYYVGSNVTKIAITPNNRTNGESVQWSRR